MTMNLLLTKMFSKLFNKIHKSMVCKDFNMKQMLIVKLIGKKESKKEMVLILTMKINLKGIMLMGRGMVLAFINLRMEAFIKANGTKI